MGKKFVELAKSNVQLGTPEWDQAWVEIEREEEQDLIKDVDGYYAFFNVLGDFFHCLGSKTLGITEAGQFIQAFKERRIVIKKSESGEDPLYEPSGSEIETPTHFEPSYQSISDYGKFLRILGDFLIRTGTMPFGAEKETEFFQALRVGGVAITPIVTRQEYGSSSLNKEQKDKKEGFVEAAKKHAKFKEYKEALEFYFAALEIDPQDSRLSLEIGDIFARMGINDKAVINYASVATRLEELGLDLKALAVYKQILRIMPDISEVRERLIRIYERLGLKNEAADQRQLLAEKKARGK